MITEAELNKNIETLKKSREEWKKRRRGAEQSAAQYGEALNLSKKAAIERVGIETDEELNVVNPL